MTNTPVFERIAILGLGLIGSSIARAVLEKHLAEHVVGYDPDQNTLAFAKKHNITHSQELDAAKAVHNCDLVILACPPLMLDMLAAEIAPSLKQGALVIDTASVKQPAIAAIAPHIPQGVDFIPAHPIAGKALSGITVGQADLFEGKIMIITPEKPRDDKTAQKLIRFCKGLGTTVEGMPPEVHDLIYGYVSHLPQLLAFAAKPLFAGCTVEGYASLQKFTRLFTSSPRLWAEICTLNKINIIKALDRYLDVIHHIIGELEAAPDDTPKGVDNARVLSTLLPRIIASCLITTVMEAEKQAGAPFARYAGTGFADFTYPATSEPEADIEQISSHYAQTASLLTHYSEQLAHLRDVLATGDIHSLETALS